MIVDSANSIPPLVMAHEPILLSENRFVLTFPDMPNGDGVFRYVLDLYMVPVDYEYQATEQYEDIICYLDGLPFAKQVSFPLEMILSNAPKLQSSFPDLSATSPGLLDPQPLVRLGFYLRQYKDGLQSDQTGAPEYTALKAGLASADFARYGQSFLSEYLDENPIFLTFQPNNKIIAPHQPDVLYFLSNFEMPPEIRSMARRHFVDGTSDDVVLGTITNPVKDRLYQIPSGIIQHELLSEPPKELMAYEIYLDNAAGHRLTEAKAFYPRYADPDAPVLIFENGLGAYDTLCCFGDSIHESKYLNDSVYLASHLSRAGADVNREFSSEITLRTGDYPPGWMPYFSQLLMSKDVRLLRPDGSTVQLLHNTEALAFLNTSEPEYGAEIKFKTDRSETQFSLLR